MSCGGVSRNIAENLARLGLNVELITVLGTDFNAHMIEQNALSVGIDISHSLVVDEPSSCYVSVNDVDNDMFVGVASMRILDKLTPEFLAKISTLSTARHASSRTRIFPIVLIF